ncbi:hypothetical protein [Cedecea davisae]|uniref:hypothetical protein n=1 Tax=Cedecea davisae TaxID=158484 RepID=UPI00242D1BC8|nr:hypothetical protein [Cedecea davisae]
MAQRLSQLTGMPVVGLHGTVVIYENIVFGNAVLPVHNFIIDAYTHGGLMGANAMLEHLRPFFSIKMLPDAQRLTETFAPPPAI